jgi:predicted ATPase
VRVQLFGSLCVKQPDGAVITHFRDKNGELILARLALRPRTQIARSDLSAWLWSEGNNPLGNLRWTLSQLRKTLGTDIFTAVGHKSVGLSPGITSDVAEFERACGRVLHIQLPLNERQAALAEAKDLAQYPFLAMHDDPWVVSERERLRARLAEAEKALSLPSSTSPPALPQENFFGRQTEMALLRAFADAPEGGLLTIVGAGGMGKTRLLREALLAHPKALGFVSLVELTTPAGIWDKLRELLQLPATGYGAVEERVTSHLQTCNDRLLLIDNAEHLLGTKTAPNDTLPQAIVQLQSACPALKIVVTSRRRLKLPDEKALALEELSLTDAEALFLARARAVNPHFATTKGGKAHVSNICHLLEWVPLALEIAAARAYLVSPAEMEQELEHRLTFLTTKRISGQARHSSVQLALDWSYGLLSDDSQRVFRHTGVFRGGFTLSGIRAVAGNVSPVLDALEELCLHHLLRATIEDSGGRYSSLETVRELAAKKLAQDPREEANALASHADFYVLQAREIGKNVENGEWAEAIDVLRTEHANLNATVQYAASKRQASVLNDLVQSLAHSCIEGGYWQDMDALLDAAEQCPESEAWGQVATFKAVLARRRGQSDAAWEAWQKAHHIFENAGDLDATVSTKIELVSQAIDEKQMSEACLLVEELLKIEEKVKDSLNLAFKIALAHVRLLFALEKRAEAEVQAESLSDRLRSTPEISSSLWLVVAYYLCPMYRVWEKWDKVALFAEEGILKAMETRQVFVIGMFLMEFGHVSLATGSPLTAVQAFWAAKEIHKGLGSRLLQESEKAFLQAQEQYGHLPEVYQWVLSDDKGTWREFTEIKFLPAHDLHMMMKYNDG